MHQTQKSKPKDSSHGKFAPKKNGFLLYQYQSSTSLLLMVSSMFYRSIYGI